MTTNVATLSNYLALNRSSSVSTKKLRNWLLLHPDFATLPEWCTPDWHGVEQDLAWHAPILQRHIITIFDAAYPKLLREIADPPLVLFIHGNLDVLDQLQFAIVGTRNPTQNGKSLAYNFAKDLATLGYTITSGLALGIDTASHKGALHATGTTIAVLGCGVDQIYPPSNSSLADQIIQNGAIISEFPIGTTPVPYNFPKRNRIISGLARGVLIIEAALKSGALITADFALEQGKEVFAVPGNLDNPVAQGCNQLIKQGAKLVVDINDIFAELAPHNRPVAMAPTISVTKLPNMVRSPPDDPIKANLLNLCGINPISTDELLMLSKLPNTILQQLLFELELAGEILAVPGGYCKATTNVS